MNAQRERQSPEDVQTIVQATREAAKYADDSVAAGWLSVLCRARGVPIELKDARELIRRARGRPRLRVIR